MAKAVRLLHLLDFLFNAVHDLPDLHLLGNLRIEPIHTRDIGAVVQSKFRIITQKLCDRERCPDGLAFGMISKHAPGTAASMRDLIRSNEITWPSETHAPPGKPPNP